MRRKQFRSEDIVRQDPPPPCNTRPCYRGCTELCKEVERWVSQDHVGLNASVVLLQDMDLPISYNSFLDRATYKPENALMVKPDQELARETWDSILSMNLPMTSLEFAELYYYHGMKLARVAAELKISAQAANDRHKKLKRDIKDRLDRIEIWREISDEYMNLEEPTNEEAVVMLFYGMLLTRTQIAVFLGIAYGYVIDLLTKFKKKRLTNDI